MASPAGWASFLPEAILLFAGIVEYNMIVFHNRRKKLETQILRPVLPNRLRPGEGTGARATADSAAHGRHPADGKARRQAFRLSLPLRRLRQARHRVSRP